MTSPEQWVQPVKDRPMEAIAAPYLTATWELPPCIGCGGTCVFDDGLCPSCFIKYTAKE